MCDEPRRLVVGISGASGAALGVRLLEQIAGLPPATRPEVHLVVTAAGRALLAHETDTTVEGLSTLVHALHGDDDLFAPIASGSFRTAGMVVAPASMKTLAGIAAGFADRLLLRAADVTLKERRPLILVARETPLSLIHLQNMRQLTLAGATIMPPVLSLYTRPATLDEVLDQIAGKALDLLGISSPVFRRWR